MVLIAFMSWIDFRLPLFGQLAAAAHLQKSARFGQDMNLVAAAEDHFAFRVKAFLECLLRMVFCRRLPVISGCFSQDMNLDAAAVMVSCSDFRYFFS